MGRFILNSRDEVAGKFYINPVAERKYTRMRCAKVSLPNTVTYAHPEEDLRFTTTRGTATQSYIISLQDLNSSDASAWATYLNNKLQAEGISDWQFVYDTNEGRFHISFTQNGTSKVVFTKECRLLGIKKDETMIHIADTSGKLSFTQQVGMSWPSIAFFVVEVTDANENMKYRLSTPSVVLGKQPVKDSPAGIQTSLNNVAASIPSTTGGSPWTVSWAVTSAGGDNIQMVMSWSAHPAGLSGNYQVAYYFNNANGYPETSETGLSNLYSQKNTGTALPDDLSKIATIATNYVNPITSGTQYEKTLNIPATEHTQADMVSLLNGLAIDGLTVTATGSNGYTLSYVRRTTPTASLYETGVLSIFSDSNVAGFNANFSYELNPFLASPATLAITLPTSPERPEIYFANVVNLVPYNHAYITCNIVTQECHASVGNEAVICEVPHAGAFMERHHYESNSEYYLPITRQDALSGIEIGIIDDLGRDLKSRLRGATYLVVLEME